VTNRSRIFSFGGAGLLVLAGAVCAVFVGGGSGELLALVLIGLGLVLATSLVFLEVGLSEDQERARNGPRVRLRTLRPRRRLERMRSHSRRLR
jgi:hypothetical protein